MGEEYLYAMLHKPCTDSEELAERERVIELMADNEEERLKLQIAFSQMGKPGKISVYEYMNSERYKCTEQIKTYFIWYFVPHKRSVVLCVAVSYDNCFCGCCCA